jgi:integrase
MGARRGAVPTDPTARVRKVVKETARDRTLTDHEIRLFWAGCDKLGWPFGPMYKLLLLTAQRRDEVGAMEWPEIIARVWTIPREKAKNDRAHEVYLFALAVEILESLPKIGTGFVLTTNGERRLIWKAPLKLDQGAGKRGRASLVVHVFEPTGALHHN